MSDYDRFMRSFFSRVPINRARLPRWWISNVLTVVGAKGRSGGVACGKSRALTVESARNTNKINTAFTRVWPLSTPVGVLVEISNNPRRVRSRRHLMLLGSMFGDALVITPQFSFANSNEPLHLMALGCGLGHSFQVGISRVIVQAKHPAPVALAPNCQSQVFRVAQLISRPNPPCQKFRSQHALLHWPNVQGGPERLRQEGQKDLRQAGTAFASQMCRRIRGPFHCVSQTAKTRAGCQVAPIEFVVGHPPKGQALVPWAQHQHHAYLRLSVGAPFRVSPQNFTHVRILGSNPILRNQPCFVHQGPHPLGRMLNTQTSSHLPKFHHVQPAGLLPTHPLDALSGPAIAVPISVEHTPFLAPPIGLHVFPYSFINNRHLGRLYHESVQLMAVPSCFLASLIIYSLTFAFQRQLSPAVAQRTAAKIQCLEFKTTAKMRKQSVRSTFQSSGCGLGNAPQALKNNPVSPAGHVPSQKTQNSTTETLDLYLLQGAPDNHNLQYAYIS